MMKPRLCQIANLWTLMQYPSREREWPLAAKLDAIREAGFDGVCWAPSEELAEGARSRGLMFLGGMASADASAFPALLRDLEQAGAFHVNVQLGTDDMLTPQALELARALFDESSRLGLAPAIETHRGTCTETPEKFYALADSFAAATGALLPVSWDFSHFGVVKHLPPDRFVERLLVRPDLIQKAQQFHFRPFNGHHAQISLFDVEGQPTQEYKDWIPFAEEVMRCWLAGNRHTGREMLICPELGPVEGGYALSTFPDSWESARRLRLEIHAMWGRVIAEMT